MTSESSPRGDLNAAIAATLNGERAAAGLTFEQLADKTGISARSLKRYLSGTARDPRDLTVTSLGEITMALNISIGEVIRRAEQRLERGSGSPPGRKSS